MKPWPVDHSIPTGRAPVSSFWNRRTWVTVDSRIYTGFRRFGMVRKGRAKNIQLWQERVDSSFDKNAIHDAIYEDPPESHPFLERLEKEDPMARDYLAFAKNCSEYNRFNSYDPWEKRTVVQNRQKKNELIDEALKRAKKVDDKRLSSRYRFLALRLAYYCKGSPRVKAYYRDFFKDRKERNIVDHWARYFRTKMMEDGPLRNHNAAQVFAHAPDKRYKIQFAYERSVPIDETLEHAGNDQERAAIRTLHAIKDPGKALEEIRKVHELRPGSKGLSFLILRELNKVEDRIQTPYYSQFKPALCVHNEHSEYRTAELVRKRIERDRKYARNLLDFLGSADMEEVHDPHLWRTGRGYLQLMRRKPDKAIETLDELLEEEELDSAMRKNAERIRALARVASQPKGDAELPEELHPVLMQNQEHSRFIFAVARELEYKGAHTEGALLLSTLNAGQDRWSDVHWRSRERHHTLYQDFYNDYFYYLDATYSPRQLNRLMADVEEGREEENSFSEWKYRVIEGDMTRLHELMGTKWIRRDSLFKAKASFERVDDTLWQSNHYSFQNYFDKDPFSWEWNNVDISIRRDSLNKERVLDRLLEHLEKASDPENPDRDLHYFKVANAYHNMTYYGNAWMMRRRIRTGLIDDEEYFSGKKAESFYEKAAETSENEKFSALCRALAGICRDRVIWRRLKEQELPYEALKKKRIAQNQHYNRLKEDYPKGTYDELMSKCLFSRYREARQR